MELLTDKIALGPKELKDGTRANMQNTIGS